MSVTLPNIRARVQAAIRQADSRKPSFGRIEVDAAIRNAYLGIQARLPANHAYVTSAGTITAGSDTFSLPTTTALEYIGDVRIRLQSNNRFLDRITIEEMDLIRNGQGTSAMGIPYRFCLWEEVDQTVQGRCNPRSVNTETYDLYRNLVAADFDLTAVDSTNIRLDRYAGLALVHKAACLLVEAMTPEDLALRRINPNITRRWDKEAEILIYQAAARRHQIASTGRLHRMVS